MANIHKDGRRQRVRIRGRGTLRCIGVPNIRFISIACMLVGLVFADPSFAGTWEASDTLVDEVEKIYEVKYDDGSEGTFMIVFSAYVSARLHEDGSPSRWNHPVDTRRCQYRVSSRIERRGYFVAGDRAFEIDEARKVYGPREVGGGENTILEEILGKHSPCSDYKREFDGKKSSVTNGIRSMFSMFIDADLWFTAESDVGVVLKASLTIRLSNQQ